MKPNLSPAEASVYLAETYGIVRSRKTLANLRSIGGGPGFKKLGPFEVLYPTAELNRWAERLLDVPVIENTAQEVA